MAPYIELNTSMRKRSTNKVEKDLYKLLNNSVFGKTIEGVRDRSEVRFVRSGLDEIKRFEKLVRNPAFNAFRVFNRNLTGVQMRAHSVVLDKPIAVGFSVLELSKLLMYEFHYDYILPRYGYEKVKLLFTDTDSLCYYIETEDLYRDLEADKDRFDFSEYPTDHPLFSLDNKMVIGKMKDETPGDPIYEVAAIKPKMYSAQTLSGYVKQTAKGVTRTARNKFTHNDYKNCIFNQKTTYVEQTTFRSRDHIIHMEPSTKLGLNPLDDKRFTREDQISTYAHFHKDAVYPVMSSVIEDSDDDESMFVTD
jgi:hypothetical protein